MSLELTLFTFNCLLGTQNHFRCGDNHYLSTDLILYCVIDYMLETEADLQLLLLNIIYLYIPTSLTLPFCKKNFFLIPPYRE